MKKVLVISYFFPPISGIGVIRVLKFVKFLPTFGWKPTILTVKRGFYKFQDQSLLKDIPKDVQVRRINYFEPGFWFKNLQWQSLLRFYLYPLILLPDAQILWFLAALWHGYKIIKKEKFDLIYTSSSSYTDHLVAYFLKKICHLNWVADFRDEWTKSDYFKFPSKIHRKIAEYLEKLFLKAADKIVTVSEPLKTSYADILGQDTDKFEVITNGFDPADFRKIYKKKTTVLKIIYAGTLYGKRNSKIIIKLMQKLKLKKIQLEFIGEDERLSYYKTIQKMQEADILLLILAPSDGPEIMTGKLYEYMACRVPILALAPKNSGAALLIKKLKIGEVAEPDNAQDIENKILKLYQKWDNNKLNVPKINLRQHERKNLTENLAKIFDQLICKISKNIRLCLIGNIQSPQNQKFCQYFIGKGYDIHFITTEAGKLSGVKEYLLKKYKFTPWYFINSLSQIKNFLKIIKPDIVHGQDLVFAGIWAYLAGFKPFVVSTWGTDVFGYQNFIKLEKILIRRTLQNANLVTGSSSALKNQAHFIGMNPKRFSLIHFGIDLDIFQKEIKKTKSKIIFCPRSIGKIYNTDIVILAFAKLVPKNKKLKLALLYNITDNNYFLKIKYLIKKLKLTRKIEFWPVVENDKMVYYYNKSAVIISVPSSDGCSVSVLEAMACEKKIVVTDLPYLADWKDGRNFWTVPTRDIQATARAMIEAYNMPDSRWNNIGRKNRQLVLKQAEIKNNFTRLDKLYRELI